MEQDKKEKMTKKSIKQLNEIYRKYKGQYRVEKTKKGEKVIFEKK